MHRLQVDQDSAFFIRFTPGKNNWSAVIKNTSRSKCANDNEKL